MDWACRELSESGLKIIMGFIFWEIPSRVLFIHPFWPKINVYCSFQNEDYSMLLYPRDGQSNGNNSWVSKVPL